MIYQLIVIKLNLLAATVIGQLSMFFDPGKALDWVFNNFLVAMVGFLVVCIGLAFANFTVKMIKFQQRQLMIAQGLIDPAVEETAPEEKESWLKIMYDRAWSLVPMDKEQDIDLGHEYDGIRELDNRLPPWWLYMFYGTIIWAGAYTYVAHFSEFKQTQTEEYYAEMEAAEKAQMRILAQQKNKIDESNIVALVDPEDIEAGKRIYDINCVACHGALGEGGVGPNLADDNWIHGGSVADIFKRIKYGVPEKGMIAWKSQLPPSSMQKVASYILTLKGTNPPNGKAPEGDIYIEPSTDDPISMNSGQ